MARAGVALDRRPAAAAPRQGRSPRAGVRAPARGRLDPEVATGLALTLALVLIVGGGLLLAVLAYLVRGDTELVRLDESVAIWGDRHAIAVLDRRARTP